MATKIINFKTRKMLGPLFVNRQPYFAKTGLSVMGLSSEEQLVKMKRLFIEMGPSPSISIVDAPQEVFAGMAGNKNAHLPSPILNLEKKMEEGISSTVITPKGARMTVRTIETVLLITHFNYGNRFRGFLDGEEVPVWSANVNMAAIILPPGVHNLELKVHDQPFNLCLIVQALLLTAVLLGTLVLWTTYRPDSS